MMVTFCVRKEAVKCIYHTNGSFPEIIILEQLPSNEHSYPGSKKIQLIPFRCSLQTFKIMLLEHSQVEWFPIEELKYLDWAEADIPIVNYYINKYK